VTITHRYLGLAACFVLASSGVVAAHAEPASANQTFLTDYSKLQPFPGKEGKDSLYIAPNVEQRTKAYTHVMVDAPEVFISPESPYKGAKPEDIAAISGLVRDAAAAALKERGYQIVDKPGANVIYVRMAVTDLQIHKKKRGLLAYTPAGFVVDTGLKAMKDFTEKYDVLDLALQTEMQDSLTGDVLAASVLQRGKSAGADEQLSFDVLVKSADALGERLACRLDNAHVAADQRIDCTDTAAREQRPQVIGR
jgi:Protein of unknown function (DUF3313)